jgi:hypothetical protein
VDDEVVGDDEMLLDVGFAGCFVSKVDLWD